MSAEQRGYELPEAHDEALIMQEKVGPIGSKEDYNQAELEVLGLKPERAERVLKVAEFFGDGSQAIQEISENGFDGAEKIMHGMVAAAGGEPKDYRKKYDDESGGRISVDHIPHPSTLAEELVGAIASQRKYIRNFDSDNRLLAAASGLFPQAHSKDEVFGVWSHSLCHLFEKYGKGTGFSYLDNPDTHDIGGTLIEEAVRRSVEADDLDQMTRILGPLLQYNMDHLDPEMLDGVFPFKPSISESDMQKFLELMDRQPDKEYHGINIKYFLDASTPKEMVAMLVENKEPFGQSPERVLKLLEAVRGDVPEDMMQEYIREIYQVDGSLTALESNFATSLEARELSEGVYVDVDDTLIDDSGELKEGILNKINELALNGHDVVIFSGGDPDEQTSRLRSLGFPEQFLPVVPKAGFKGKLLEILIDDTSPEYQGFGAKSYHVYGRQGFEPSLEVKPK